MPKRDRHPSYAGAYWRASEHAWATLKPNIAERRTRREQRITTCDTTLGSRPLLKPCAVCT
eukprot:6265406-Pyramimonas_sp.AAC.1